MSVFNVKFRIPFEKATDWMAFGHVCGEGDESHAWNPRAVHIVAPPGTFSMIVLFVILGVRPVVLKATEISGVGGAIRMTTVSLIVSGRKSYDAPGIFA